METSHHILAHASSAPQQSDKGHHLHWLLGGTALAVGAIIFSPYLLSALGVAPGILENLHDASAQNTGLAKIVNESLITPVLGETLAKNGFLSGGAAAVTGIGGLLLAHLAEKREDPNASFHWSSVIRVAALATSALIALPALLSGLTVGLSYLAHVMAGEDFAHYINDDAKYALNHTLGAIGMDHDLMGQAGGLLPHLLICGSAVASACATLFMASKSGESHKNVSDFPPTLLSAAHMQWLDRQSPAHGAARLI